MKNHLLKGGAWLLIGRILSIGVSFLFSALVVRSLNKEDAGLLFLWMSWLSFAVIVSQLGLKTQVVRLIAGSTPDMLITAAKHVAYRVISLNFVMLIFVISVFWVLNKQLEVFHNTSKSLFLLTSLWLIVTSFISLSAEFFRGLGIYKVVALLEGETSLFVYLGSSLFIMTAYFMGWSIAVEDVILAMVLSGFLLLFFLLLPLLFLENKSVEKNVSVKEMLEYSYPLYFHFILLAILSKVGFWALGLQGHEEGLVYYGVSLFFSNAIIFPLVIVNALLPSFIVRLQKHSMDRELQSLLSNSAAIAALLSLLVGILLFMFGGSILELFYGKGFLVALPVLKILIVGQLVNVFCGASGLLLSISGQQHSLLRSTVWSTTLVALFAWLLVPVWGAEGAALATSIGIVVQNVMMVYFARQKLGVNTYASLGYMGDILKMLNRNNVFKND